MAVNSFMVWKLEKRIKASEGAVARKVKKIAAMKKDLVKMKRMLKK